MGQKLTDLTILNTTPDAADPFYVVDVSDTTMGVDGTSKQILFSVLTAGFATSGANSNITSLTGLSTPLTVAQGGSGAVTLTGILKGNGTSAFTAVTAPSGAIVGTTDSQTLTNKDLSSGTNTLPTAVVTLTGSQTLTNKTLTTPIIATISNTGTVTLPTATDTLVARATSDTLTNKRITARVLSAASYTTDTGSSLNGDTQDIFVVTAQTGALKFNNPSGTPTEGQKLIIRVASSTTSARALTWDTAFLATTVALPTTTTATTAMLNIGFIYEATSPNTGWQCVAVS